MSSVRAWALNRYTIFLVVVAVSAVSPAFSHMIEPDPAWWLAAVGILVLMVAVGWLGARLPGAYWLATVAPFLLFPAVHALRCSDGNATSGFAPLLMLPVIWFALYGRLWPLALSILAEAITLVLPVIIVGAPQYPATTWRGIVLQLLISAGVSALIFRLVQGMSRGNRRLARSESEFRAAFENAPVGMAITGLRGADARRFLRVNRALCEIFGRTAAELTSAPVATFTHPEDLALTDYHFDNVDEPDVPHRIEKRYLHKSGRTIWAMVSYSVVTGADGRPSHVITQIEDLGARRESDQALLDAYESDRAAKEQLAWLERVRAEMASTVSHELRTPLTSAAGYVELLLEGDAGPLTDEQRAMLDTVTRSLGRLDGIVGDVLSLANTDNAGAQPATAVADMGKVVTAAIASVALQAAAKGQDIVSRLDLDGVCVRAEPGRLERLFVNLISNALKFTPDDGTITLAGSHDDAEVRVAVSDNGVGIAPDDQQRIFERFYRVDADAGLGDAPSGTGLGLAIVQAIATQYGGKVTVESTPGRGSTFTVVLPRPPAGE